MKTVKYTGPHRPGVDLVVDGRTRTVSYDESTQVPDDVADNLLAQDDGANWEIVNPPAKGKEKPAEKAGEKGGES